MVTLNNRKIICLEIMCFAPRATEQQTRPCIRHCKHLFIAVWSGLCVRSESGCSSQCSPYRPGGLLLCFSAAFVFRVCVFLPFCIRSLIAVNVLFIFCSTFSFAAQLCCFICSEYFYVFYNWYLLCSCSVSPDGNILGCCGAFAVFGLRQTHR